MKLLLSLLGLLMAGVGAAVPLAHTQAPAKTDFLPAFPGAEGAGAKATGGRGGRVLFVTNLNDSGPGSLRTALQESGPRTVLFRVSGTIALKSKLSVQSGDLTIAGQSAPGGGICLKGNTLSIAAPNVIVRHLRLRLGDEEATQADAMTVWHGADNVIVDHCSASWSVDEALSLGGNNSQVTVQWCLIGEALHRSRHVKGSHGYGSLMRASGPVSLHHNLWAHNDARNPRLGDNYGKAPFPTFDVRNNVIYDFGGTASGLTQGNFPANLVGNYYRSGPGSRAKTPMTIGGPSQLRLYLQGNEWEGHDDFSRDNSRFPNQLEVDGKPAVELLTAPVEMPPVCTTSAREAWEAVLAGAGATLPRRDSVDARIVQEARSGTGKHIDSQKDVGGWPVLESTPAPADSDEDGMPDAWERAHKLNASDAGDGAKDTDGDGYTNLEEFLNGMDPQQFVDYRDPKNNVDTISVSSLKEFADAGRR